MEYALSSFYLEDILFLSNRMVGDEMDLLYVQFPPLHREYLMRNWHRVLRRDIGIVHRTVLRTQCMWHACCSPLLCRPDPPDPLFPAVPKLKALPLPEGWILRRCPGVCAVCMCFPASGPSWPERRYSVQRDRNGNQMSGINCDRSHGILLGPPG